jgi:hypothetical protein
MTKECSWKDRCGTDRCARCLRAENTRLRSLLKEVLIDSMGGMPDLFCPDHGWEEWDERARAALKES